MSIPKGTAAWTVAAFGLMAVLFGVAGLVSPETTGDGVGFAALGADGRTFLAASSMASLNMGVYYLVAAATGWRPFFVFTVPFRLLTCTVFTMLVSSGTAPTGFLAVAAWEALGAVATGIGLAIDSRRRNRATGLT